MGGNLTWDPEYLPELSMSTKYTPPSSSPHARTVLVPRSLIDLILLVFFRASSTIIAPGESHGGVAALRSCKAL